MKRIISIILSLTTLFSVNGVCFGAESAEPSALAAAKLSAVTAAAIDGADELLWPHVAEESDETEDAAAQESHRLAEEQAAQHAPSEAELYGEAESGAELFSAQNLTAQQLTKFNTVTAPTAGNGANEPKFSYNSFLEEDISDYSGELTLRFNDLMLEGRNGLDLRIGRTYQTVAANVGEKSVVILPNQNGYLRNYLVNRYSTYLQDRYDLGTGWGFGFPSVQIETSYEVGLDEIRVSKTTGNVTTTYGTDENGKVITENSDEIINGHAPLAKKSGAAYYYYIYNGHGDVVMLLDENDNTKNTYEYDPWGSITTQTETIDNSIKYAGEYFDDETGLIYLRNRYYDPSVGPFISEDPIRDGANWYVYANNNPVNYVDPTGLDAIVITDDEAAGNFGHTSAIYQDADGNWFYTYWGNKAAAVIRIPDTYVKEYRRNGDISGNSMDSLADFNKSLNRFLSDNGFTDITSNYDQATYIVDDFTASLQAAYDDVNLAATNKHSKGDLRALDDGSKVFQGHNSPYNVAYRNCLDKTYASLSKGILANGMNAGTYMKDLGFNGGMRPDNAAPKFSQHFLNSSFTYDGAYSGALNYATLFVQKSPWAQVWAKANYANAIVGW